LFKSDCISSSKVSWKFSTSIKSSVSKSSLLATEGPD
jgi:hypothetical protein